ncbi:acyltransferase [Streptomyces hydrogenans]|uniref:acyltransferase n=1 Tax=Streptomyces hydrogenans TaxID=1873719 RepID=UPI0035D7FBE7
MSRAGERQGDLAAAIGLSQAQVSRKQSGAAHWSLDDVDLLAAHYDLPVLDLLAGPTHAVGVLHGAAPGIQSAATAPTDATRKPGPEPAPEPVAEPAPESAPEPVTEQAPAPVAESVTEDGPVRALPTPGPPLGPCVLCGQTAFDEVDGFPQHLSAEACAAAAAAAAAASAPPVPPSAASPAPAPASSAPEPPQPAPAQTPPTPTAPPTPPASPATPPRRTAPAYVSSLLVEQITDRVREVLTDHDGDVDAAQAALIKSAIPDVMALFKASRASGRYEHSDFPPTADILRKKSQKGADEIWEGRPKWRNPAVFAAAKQGTRFEVTALDMNAAYLSALKCWLPIGQLREDTSGVHDPKKSGVHLITPADWEQPDLPNPLGNRIEPGQLWVTESTLRQLLACSRKGLAGPPVLHLSLVSGASEALLERLRRALADVRRTALAEGDTLTVEYVKAMYAKFVSTIGESSANREIRRPDWMHIIRAKAFANLWMKAEKARLAGLTVVEMSGTDELHVVGDWRSVFGEGRDLHEVKAKKTYTLGGK